jgi:hypothetical protein
MNADAARPIWIKRSRLTPHALPSSASYAPVALLGHFKPAFAPCRFARQREEESECLTRLVKPKMRAEFIMFAMNSF